MKFLHFAVDGVAWWPNRCDDVVECLLVRKLLGAMSLSNP
jgi:hypothetical protein